MIWLGVVALAVAALAGAEGALRAWHRHVQLNQPVRPGLRPETLMLNANTLDNCLRIVALGDSITHGLELPEAQTYPALLCQKLSDWLRRPVAVINSGVPGETVLQGLERVDWDVIRYRPALVLIAFGINDAYPARTLQDERRERDILGKDWEAWLRRSHLYRTINARVRRLFQRRPENWTVHPILAVPRVSLEAFRVGLRRLAQRIERAGGQVVIVTLHPTLCPELRHLSEYWEVARSVSRELGCGLADLEAHFRVHNMAGLLESDGIHLMAAGQAVLAELLFDALVEQNIIRRVI